MKRAPSSIIGLALGERSISVVEVALGSRPTPEVRQTAAFALPVDTSLDQFEAVGQALKTFLRSKDFGASQVIIGLPARWLIAREQQVPPVAASTGAAMLRLQAERLFPPELKDMVFDYAGQTDSSQPKQVLLLATSQQRISNAAMMAKAAGLSPLAVTSTSLCLSSALDAESAKILLSLGDDSAELVVRSSTGPRALRHLPVTGEQLVSSNGAAAAGLSTIGGELLRAATQSASSELLVWDGVGLKEGALSNLTSRAGLAVSTQRDLKQLNITAGATETGEFGPAIAVALAGLRGTVPVDFLHSRLAPPKQRHLGRKAGWAIAAGAVLVLAIAGTWWDTYTRQANLDAMTAKLAEMQPAVKSAQNLASKLNFARGWSDARTPVLDCMEHITLAFPQEGYAWATSLTFHDTGKGTLMGKSMDQREALAVYDILTKDKKFSDVKVDTHPGANAREIAFTITFTYNGGN